jgi:hypothetical protein
LAVSFPSGLDAILATYGNPLDYASDHALWETTALLTLPLVTPLPYAYGDVTITRIRAHYAIVDDLVTLLGQAAALCIDDLSRVAFGGTYAWRAKRTADELSLHTWGVAIDLNPRADRQGVPYDPLTGVPQSVVDLFEAAGWCWGGRFTTDPDPMHFQAAFDY